MQKSVWKKINFHGLSLSRISAKTCLALLFTFFFGLACKEDSKLTLKQVMDGLGKDLNLLVEATMKGDLELAQNAATRIAEHPKPMKAQRKKIIDHLGEERSEMFRTADVNVHLAASRTAEAAKAGDLWAVSEGTLEIQRYCISCHRNFQDEIRALLSEGAPQEPPGQQGSTNMQDNSKESMGENSP